MSGRAVLAALIEGTAARAMHKLTSRVFPENAASRTLLRGFGFDEIDSSAARAIGWPLLNPVIAGDGLASGGRMYNWATLVT